MNVAALPLWLCLSLWRWVVVAADVDGGCVRCVVIVCACMFSPHVVLVLLFLPGRGARVHAAPRVYYYCHPSMIARRYCSVRTWISLASTVCALLLAQPHTAVPANFFCLVNLPVSLHEQKHGGRHLQPAVTTKRASHFLRARRPRHRALLLLLTARRARCLAAGAAAAAAATRGCLCAAAAAGLP